MGTRTLAQVAPTSATIALNAYIFGYGGHSLVTPHTALKQLWWTDARIDAKVTRSFVISKLRGEERDFLDKRLAFGEGLTDDTYMEWILERAKRLFLILTEVGVPDQIFGCIDDSWDDEDLPIPLESVRNLELSYENDETLNKKFYDTQFLFLLRELKQGSHLDYGPREHIPMEYVNTLPPAVTLQAWDRVHFPGRPDDIFMRRKYALSDKDTKDYQATFLRDVKKAQTLGHEHIASTWASYTSENAAYMVSNFVGEHTLGTFIDHRTPQQFMRVSASERPNLLCEWMHCLADALASLHHRGTAHTAIRPSNILVDHDNHIAFADVGSLRTFQRGKKVNKVEIYNYAAPESQLSEPPLTLASSPPASSIGAFNKMRKMSSSTSSSSTASSAGSIGRSGSVSTVPTSPITPPSSSRSDSLMSISSSLSPSQKATGSIRNFSRHIRRGSAQSSRTARDLPTSSTTELRILPKGTIIDPNTLRDLPEASSEMSDIFSMGCIFLEIITFLVKGKINDFVKFRTSRMASLSPRSTRARSDQSYHANADKIDAWISMLEDDSRRRTESVFGGIPVMLGLTRRMMVQNATVRPTAMEVRDQLRNILTESCGIENLCCASQSWESTPITHNATRASRSHGRDSLSIATGLYATPSRNGSDCPRSASGGDDITSIYSRSESGDLNARDRRRSSASTATAKLSSWRRTLTRSP